MVPSPFTAVTGVRIPVGTPNSKKATALTVAFLLLTDFQFQLGLLNVQTEHVSLGSQIDQLIVEPIRDSLAKY